LNIFIVFEIRAFGRLIFFTIVLLLLGMFIGKKKEKLAGLVSALSLVYIADTIGSVVLAIGMVFFVPISLVRELSNAVYYGNTINLEELMSPFYQINFAGLFVVLAVVLILLILMLAIFYNVVKKYLNASTIPAIIIAVAILLVTTIVPKIFQ